MSEQATIVRTRFAPSPTGMLHVGSMRTAVFAWLTARHANGQFILRLEDTDKKREVEGSDQHIIDCLKALNLDYDEGPDKPGAYGPYRQSERLPIYKKWADQLIASGRAYADPYTPEQIDEFRQAAIASKQPFLFRNHRPDNPPSWDGSQPLRFKSDPKPYKWHDVVMGDMSTEAEVIDDFILIKSDGFPTYNFAHIIDDCEMKVTHIIRGQEFIASVPNYLNLYEALGLRPPTMATVPHVLAPGGQRKLSKRDDAKDVLDYLRDGFLPETLVNFITSLGWNDGTEQEIFSREELVSKFSLDRISRSGASFDERRLVWMNGVYIREMPLDQLSDKVANYWPEEAASYDEEYKKQVLSVVQERLKYFGELPELSRFFFAELPVDPKLIEDHKQLKKMPLDEQVMLLVTAREKLAACSFSVDSLAQTLNDLLEATQQKPAILFSLIRIATTEAPSSPGLADTLAVLGKERTLKRIDTHIEATKDK